MRAILMTTVLAMALAGEAFAQSTPNAPPVPIQQGSAVVQADGTIQSGEQAAENADGRPDPDAEVICRVVQESGTRLARRRQRICGTRTMWESMQDQNHHDLRGPVVQGETG